MYDKDIKDLMDDEWNEKFNIANGDIHNIEHHWMTTQVSMFKSKKLTNEQLHKLESTEWWKNFGDHNRFYYYEFKPFLEYIKQNGLPNTIVSKSKNKEEEKWGEICIQHTSRRNYNTKKYRKLGAIQYFESINEWHWDWVWYSSNSEQEFFLIEANKRKKDIFEFNKKIEELEYYYENEKSLPDHHSDLGIYLNWEIGKCKEFLKQLNIFAYDYRVKRNKIKKELIEERVFEYKIKKLKKATYSDMICWGRYENANQTRAI